MLADLSSSFFIARLLGPAFLLIGLGALLREDMYRAVLREMSQRAALLYLSGFMGFMAGLALVLTHNVWTLEWRLIITLIGWLTLVRGYVIMFQPQMTVAVVARILARREIFYAAAAIDVLIGLALVYFGYFP